MTLSYGWGEKTNTSFKIVPFIIDMVLLLAEEKKKTCFCLMKQWEGYNTPVKEKRTNKHTFFSFFLITTFLACIALTC